MKLAKSVKLCTIGLLHTFLIVLVGCSKTEEINNPPPYISSSAIEESDTLRVYQLYTTQFINLDLNQKMLVYHLYRTCIFGQDLAYDNDIQTFYIGDSQSALSTNVSITLRNMINELELSLEFSDGETKKAIWAFIQFLQSGGRYLLREYYEQVSKTFDSDVIFCFDFTEIGNMSYSFTHIRELKYFREKEGLFNGAILISNQEAERKKKVIHDISKRLGDYVGEPIEFTSDESNLRPCELICVTGLYGPRIYPTHSQRNFKLKFTAALLTDILITNLLVINVNEVYLPFSNDSSADNTVIICSA